MDCYRFVRAKPDFSQELPSKGKLYLCRSLVLFIFCMFLDKIGILKATPHNLRANHSCAIMRYCLIKKVVSKMFGKLKNLFGGDSGIEVTAPVAGKVVALEDVPDPTFAQGILGPGIAIEPAEGRIVAPADGTVDVMFETGHAVSLTTADGAELLIHVGIDTVQLEGKHYKACCKAGQQVKKGDVLIEFDPAAIKAEGYQIVTPILVCNPDAFTVEPAAGGTVAAGDALLTLKKK